MGMMILMAAMTAMLTMAAMGLVFSVCPMGMFCMPMTAMLIPFTIDRMVMAVFVPSLMRRCIVMV
ncbi:MAG: hypothetical protein SWH68_10935 [Thermodesulfobacteriota bacterium]|nr:hypothetical protein [Thermodesulfobacteriota bacterium]